MSFSQIQGWLSRAPLGAALCLALLFSAGCAVNPIYSVTGKVMTGYAENYNTPYVLSLADPDLTCTMGSALDPLVYSFKTVTDTPYKTGSLLMLLSAECSEQKAWDADLRSIRAERAGQVSEAEDARTESKRWQAVTARRRLQSFQEAMKAYDYDYTDPNVQCPDFDTDQDELTFLMGLVTGLQAIMNDSASGVMVNVPRDIAPEAERAARCLSNRKWAGLPDSVRAAVWLLIPATKPKDAPNPWVVMKQDSKLGVEKGMRAAGALEVVMAESLGKDKILADAIHRFAAGGKTMKVWKQYRLVDEVARQTVMAVSDRYWTRHYGRRTPALRFGDLSKDSGMSGKALDDLL